MIDLFGKKAQKEIKRLNNELDYVYKVLGEIRESQKATQEELLFWKEQASEAGWAQEYEEKEQQLIKDNAKKIQEISQKFVIQRNGLVEKLNKAMAVLEEYAKCRNGKKALLVLDELKKDKVTTSFTVFYNDGGAYVEFEKKDNTTSRHPFS